MLKKLLTIVGVSALCFSAAAQNIEGVNARLDAIAGSGPSDDIGWTIKHPASIYAYPNTWQGTICLMPLPGIDRTFGAIIGIVKFSELFYAGVTLNNRLEMPASFYSEGALIMKPNQIDGEDYAKGFPNLPQVNLCFKFSDNFKLGLGGIFEGASYSYKATKKLPYATASGSDTIKYTEEHGKKTVRNVGFNVEARVTLGSLTWYPQFIMEFPTIGGEETYNTLTEAKAKLAQINASGPLPAPVSDLSLTWESKQGKLMRGASYFWTDIGNTFWITGIIYTNKRYQFNKNTDILTQTLNADGSVATTDRDETYDSLPSDRNNNMIDFFIGCIPSFSDNLYFAPEYDGGIGIFKAKDPDMPADTNFLSMYHNFRLGIEKVVKSMWIFDEVAFRCGMMAQWNKEWRYVDNFDNLTEVSEEAFPMKSFFWGSDFAKKEAKITGGFGFKKSRGTFDISCNFVEWKGQGIIAGPTAAMATLTVDFGRDKEF